MAKLTKRTVDGIEIKSSDYVIWDDGYIQGLLDGVAFGHTSYALDRDSRKSALAHFLGQTSSAPREAKQAVV